MALVRFAFYDTAYWLTLGFWLSRKGYKSLRFLTIFSIDKAFKLTQILEFSRLSKTLLLVFRLFFKGHINFRQIAFSMTYTFSNTYVRVSVVGLRATQKHGWQHWFCVMAAEEQVLNCCTLFNFSIKFRLTNHGLPPQTQSRRTLAAIRSRLQSLYI